MIKLRPQNYLDRVSELAFAKSYGLKNLVKLGVGQEIFKNTIEERPSKKSCSTKFSVKIFCKIFSPTKF